jgi:hypothetical protein
MSELIEVNVGDLKGPALDWAVAHATKAWEWAHNWFPTMTLDPTFSGISDDACGVDGAVVLIPRNAMRQEPQEFRPSLDWSQGGRLIEEHGIKIERSVNGYTWYAGWLIPGIGWNQKHQMWDGETALEAACRALVDLKLGNEVKVPRQLLP